MSPVDEPPADTGAGLDADYAAAWDDWATTGEQEAWERTAGDGLGGAAR